MATKNIEIKPLQMEEVRVKIVGDTSLIVHAFSEKAKRMMLDAQRGKKTTKKHEIKIPMNDFMDSLHWLTEKPEHGEVRPGIMRRDAARRGRQGTTRHGLTGRL